VTIFGRVPSERRTSQRNVNRANFKRIPFGSPAEAFLKLRREYEYAFLLESRGGKEKVAQYSFIGFDPETVVSVKDGEASLLDECYRVDDPLEPMKNCVGIHSSPSPFRFVGGAVGYVSYDAVRYWEKLPDASTDDLGFPDIEMGIYDDGLIFDHLNREAYYFYISRNRYDDIDKALKGAPQKDELSFGEPKVNIGTKRYKKIVERAKEYISSGDIFQVVLSKRYSSGFKGDLAAFYLALRRINPSPYMYFLEFKDRWIIGSSPEMLVRVENGVAETFPIAGTRPRTGDSLKDAALENDLLTDPKELAEHLMLLDLARNDIGKVSDFGSVRVPEFMKVHRYSHVQHIVSQVIGKVGKSFDRYDVLRAVFPAGTVSGAPKMRAMEIIEELEPNRRGPYAGAVGYFSYNGNMDFAITIRTLFAKEDRLHIQVGSGIVADSTSENEWLETEYKAQALIKALGI